MFFLKLKKTDGNIQMENSLCTQSERRAGFFLHIFKIMLKDVEYKRLKCYFKKFTFSVLYCVVQVLTNNISVKE